MIVFYSIAEQSIDLDDEDDSASEVTDLHTVTTNSSATGDAKYVALLVNNRLKTLIRDQCAVKVNAALADESVDKWLLKKLTVAQVSSLHAGVQDAIKHVASDACDKLANDAIMQCIGRRITHLLRQPENFPPSLRAALQIKMEEWLLAPSQSLPVLDFSPSDLRSEVEKSIDLHLQLLPPVSGVRSARAYADELIAAFKAGIDEGVAGRLDSLILTLNETLLTTEAHQTEPILIGDYGGNRIMWNCPKCRIEWQRGRLGRCCKLFWCFLCSRSIDHDDDAFQWNSAVSTPSAKKRPALTKTQCYYITGLFASVVTVMTSTLAALQPSTNTA